MALRGLYTISRKLSFDCLIKYSLYFSFCFFSSFCSFTIKLTSSSFTSLLSICKGSAPAILCPLKLRLIAAPLFDFIPTKSKARFTFADLLFISALALVKFAIFVQGLFFGHPFMGVPGKSWIFTIGTPAHITPGVLEVPLGTTFPPWAHCAT